MSDAVSSSGKAVVWSRLTAAGVALPFLLAVPNHHDPKAIWWNVGLWSLVGAIFLCTQFAAFRVASLPKGNRLVGSFAALYLVLGLLGFVSTEHYRLVQPATDFSLLYLVFFSGALLAGVHAAIGRVALVILVVALSLTAIVQAVHLQTFGFAIGPDGYRAILQSNAGEATEFVGHYLDSGVLASAAVATGVVVAAAFGVLPPRLSANALLAGGGYALAAIAIIAHNPALVTPKAQGLLETVDYAVEIVEYQTVRAARKARDPTLQVRQTGPLADRPQTHVFVVGESLTRNHMSLYGYWRDTTPALERLAPEMVVFTDVISPHSHTDQSLELVLTLANQSNGLRFTDSTNYSLIELLRAAGFTTWWISNQNTFGPWDNKTAVLAGGADHLRYVSARSGRMVTGPYDEVLLGPFADALRDSAPRKAIFLHFLGNHWQYANRYPPALASYHTLPSAAEIGALSKTHRRPDLINHYDNAVRYHDHLVARVVEMLRATGQPAFLALIADHGESLYDLKGHYWQQFTPDHVEIPMLIWFSPLYAELTSDFVRRSQARVTMPFTIEDLPHLVADLIGLESPVIERERSPLSSSYRAPDRRYLFEKSIVYEDADEPRLNARAVLGGLARMNPELFPKIWAHRVNTLAKMREVANLFAGAEIDIVYDPQARELVVNHPPDPPSGLTLKALLRYADKLNPSLWLWLDVKNLNETNGGRVIEELERLHIVHGIRQRSVIETDHAGPVSTALRAAGFHSSYYLPTRFVTQYEAADRATSCYGAAEIRQTVDARRFAAISYDWRGQRWVDRCLGEFVRERALPRYAWDLEFELGASGTNKKTDWDRFRAYGELAAILVPYRSPFDDRR